MAIDHDVDVIADRVAHGGDVVDGPLDGSVSFDRHRFRDGHRFERGVAIFDCRLGEFAKAFVIVATRFVEVFEFAAAEMGIGADVVADRTAPEFGAGHPGDFAHDVPEGDIDAGDGGRADDAVAMPEMLAIHHLPEIFDAGWVFADEELAEILDRADDAAGVPFEGRFTPADEPGLIGGDFDEDPVAHPRVADEWFDLDDFHEVIPFLSAWLECAWNAILRKNGGSVALGCWGWVSVEGGGVRREVAVATTRDSSQARNDNWVCPEGPWCLARTEMRLLYAQLSHSGKNDFQFS